MTKFESKFYSVDIANNKLSFKTKSNSRLIDNLNFSYSTCEIYNIRSPLANPQVIELDHVANLKPGDSVIVTNNKYGGSALQNFWIKATISYIKGCCIGIDTILPPHIMRSVAGLIVLKRTSYTDALPPENLRIEPSGQDAVLLYNVSCDHFNMAVKIQLLANSPHVDVQCKTSYLQHCKLFHQGIVIESPLVLQDLHLKNRTIRNLKGSKPLHDIWLGKEGCRVGTPAAEWVIQHAPGIACIEVITQGKGYLWKTVAPTKNPKIIVSLEHYQAQRFRRRVIQNNPSTSQGNLTAYEELSAPHYNKGDEVEHNFRLFLGSNLPSVPRLMLTPNGYRASHIWTEHADRTNIHTHRAAYYGHEDISNPEDAVGGFVKYGHVVTKSIFHSNPRQYGGESGHISYNDDSEFQTMLDKLSDLGHEICLHTATPDGVGTPEETHQAIAEIASHFKSPTWIDHNYTTYTAVRSCISYEGSLPSSPYYMIDKWKEYNIRYFWNAGSEDFAPRKIDGIDLLHNSNGDYTPTPLYWRVSSLPKDIITWSANECHIEYYKEEVIDALIKNRGISIHHHYYPFIESGATWSNCNFNFIEKNQEDRYVATQAFNHVLSTMANRKQAGELYLTTIGELLPYWLAIEHVQIELCDQGRFELINKGDTEIKGLSFVIRANHLNCSDIPFQSRSLDDGDLLVWFDMPPGARYRFIADAPLQQENYSRSQRTTEIKEKRQDHMTNTVKDIDWLLNEEKGFVLFFRPRCGSTTLTRWFFENMGVKFGGFSISQFRNEWLEPRLEHLQNVFNTRYQDLHKFVVIRDPLQRAVSSYLHVVNNKTDAQWSVVQPFVDPNLQKHDLTFRQWVQYLGCIDLDQAHIIWRRQSALSCWDRGVDDVIKMEDMNEYLLKMNERFGLEAKPTFNSVTVPPQEKKHLKKTWFRNNCYADTPFHELLKFKGKAWFENFPDYSYFYDKKLRRDIENLYDEDFKIFSMAQEKPNLLKQAG